MFGWFRKEVEGSVRFYPEPLTGTSRKLLFSIHLFFFGSGRFRIKGKNRKLWKIVKIIVGSSCFIYTHTHTCINGVGNRNHPEPEPFAKKPPGRGASVGHHDRHDHEYDVVTRGERVAAQIDMRRTVG